MAKRKPAAARKTHSCVRHEADCNGTATNSTAGANALDKIALRHRRARVICDLFRSERVGKRAADSLPVGAPRLQALPGIEFDHILTVRDGPQLRDPSEVHDV